jgi:Cellulase (glycosyl hydrolase family 5)
MTRPLPSVENAKMTKDVGPIRRGVCRESLRRIRITRDAIRFIALVLALAALSCSWARAEESEQQEQIARTTQTHWEDVRGVNFIPSYAANTYEIWRNYDHDLFDFQLNLASDVGFNTVRLWLNYAAYEEMGPKMVDRVEDALRLCAKHHLRAVMVLFDSCGVRPRKDTRWMDAQQAYGQFQSSSRFNSEDKALMERLFYKYTQGFGAKTQVPVAPDSPMMALLYQKWMPTPGNDRLGPDWYSRLQLYVDAVFDRLKDNPNVLLWDLMNEPEWASENLSITPEMRETRDTFLRYFEAHIKHRYPEALVCIGWAQLKNAEQYSQLADIVTFHIYGSPAQIQSAIDEAQLFANHTGKVMLITETLANWDFGSPDFGRLATDEEQLAHYQRMLPTLLKSPVGWISWGLVISHDFDPFTDIFYPDGVPRPAATFLEKTMKQGRAAAAAP